MSDLIWVRCGHWKLVLDRDRKCNLWSSEGKKNLPKDASRLWREMQYWVILVCHQRLLISHYASPCIVGMKILRAAVMWFFYIRPDNCMAVIIICAVPLVRKTLVSASTCFRVRRKINWMFGLVNILALRLKLVHFVPSYIPKDNWTKLGEHWSNSKLEKWLYSFMAGRVKVGGWTAKEGKGSQTENVWLI